MRDHYVIREATQEDAPMIVKAQKEIAQNPGYFVSLPHEFNEQMIIKTIKALSGSAEGIFLVAECKGKIVGHAYLEPLHLKSISHVTSLTIGVYPGWQEQGVGTKLLQELISWAKHNKNVEKIELNVRASNIRAIALYKKMGFVEEGRLKNRIKISDTHYIDDVLMALET